ncbi:MAG TPA: hypothetical protein VM802_11345 [Chitinophaga sp.]|uniref:lipopolysaccharide biosynthesis protein n=1 Tax=Chitinophaga sp. TaxID=1869181 RepID=UPI002B538899|nr:lipopolysaccharide biosynthesis protein [Chitinophaga sp.]HVI45460.1 hypothetical protein [Chitinophaga sp.]
MELQKHSTEVVNQDDEISLKDLVLQLQQWWRYLLSKWYIVFLAGILGGGLGLIYALYKKPLYVANLTFVLEDSKSSPLGAYAGLASQFGVDLNGSSSAGVFTGENIIEFLKTRLIVNRALILPISVDGKNMSLADFYLDINGFKEKWKNQPAGNITLPASAAIDPLTRNYSRLQDSVLQVIYADILKDKLSVGKPDKKLGFINVKCTSGNEIFSKMFVERVVKEAISFYLATKTKRSQSNVDRLQRKVDSIEALLNKKTYSAAVAQDLNLNPAKRTALVGTELITRDKVMLQGIYGELVKNLEISKMTLEQETPIIQIVDTPVLPLEKEKTGRLKGIIIGALVAGLFIISYLTIRRALKKAMS